MGPDQVAHYLTALLLASLRLAPVFLFAPPFTLVKLPTLVRTIWVLALGATMVGDQPGLPGRLATPVGLAIGALGEVGLGIGLALALQMAFAAIGMAGRTLDIQAGFGLAFLIDPTTKAQMPLIGAIFNYAAAAIFFATSAPHDLLAVLGASFENIPIGGATAPQSLGPLLAFLSTVFVLAVGLVGLAVLALFLIDLVIAFMSRTLAQMNVLVLGFQVKSIAALLLLPATLALTGAGIMRIFRLSVEAMRDLG